MKTLFKAGAATNGGRDGHTQTDDQKISLKLARPDSGQEGVNPEQLFACGYSACFGSAVSAVARKKNINLKNVKVHADISLNQSDEGRYFLGAVLDVSLSDIEQSVAESLVKDAHQVCPYSQAIRNNVEVKLMANGQEIKQG